MKTIVKMLLHDPDIPPMTLLGPVSSLSEVHALCGRDHDCHGLGYIPDLFIMANENVQLYNTLKKKLFDVDKTRNADVRCVIEIGDANVAEPSDYAFVYIVNRFLVSDKNLLRYMDYAEKARNIPGIGCFFGVYLHLGHIR